MPAMRRLKPACAIYQMGDFGMAGIPFLWAFRDKAFFQTLIYRALIYSLTILECRGTIVLVKIIADTSIFIAVALNEPEKEIIISLTEGHDLVAPEVLPFEIGNALTAMVKRRTLSANEAVLAWDVIQHIPVDLRRINIAAALKIAMQHNTYAYDAYFLECAFSQRSPLLTLDRQMTEIAGKIGIQIMA